MWPLNEWTSFWNPVTCFAASVLVYVISEFLSHKTKGNVSSLLFASFIFLFGFWGNVFPADLTTKPGLVAAMSNFGVALLIVNLGTLIELETLINEWKTALIALLGLVGIALVAFTVGSVLFGREYALISAPPIAGATVAGIIMQSAANEAGQPELAAFVVLVLSFQKFFGMPIATWGIKKEISRKQKTGDFLAAEVGGLNITLPSMRIFKKPVNPALNTSNMYLCKLALVATLANFVGLATRIPGSDPANYILNPNISYLLFGLIFTRIGFLEKSSLNKSQSYGLMMLGLMLMLPGSLANVTPAGLMEMIWPLFGMLALSTIGIAVISALVGKLVGYSTYISWAIAFTCMLGYPATEILTNEVVNAAECQDEEERARIHEYILPKMILGGFVTVTIASVAFAGLMSPMIFR